MDSPPDAADDLRDWLDLPLELTKLILLKLGPVEILMSAQKVCSTWRRLCKEPSMWRSIDMRFFRSRNLTYDKSKNRLFRREAVARSCGQLVDVVLGLYGDDVVLRNIVESSSQLKCLRLGGSYSISDEGLRKAAAKLPWLEELDISFGSFSKKTLEVVGRCCPLLKTLKFNRFPSNDRTKSDEEALAIGQNMHGLHKLHLLGSDLTDDGLQAILDGCPQLQLLDIRVCDNVSLAGNLDKRCTERIKVFRRCSNMLRRYPEIKSFR